MSRNASVGDVAGTTMKKTLTYLLLLRRSPLPWPRLRRMPPPTGGGGVGTDRDAGWRMGTRSRGRGRRRGRDCRRDHRIPAAGLLGSSYISGRSRDWLKFKNPAAPSVKREAEEEWGKQKWR